MTDTILCNFPNSKLYLIRLYFQNPILYSVCPPVTHPKQFIWSWDDGVIISSFGYFCPSFVFFYTFGALYLLNRNRSCSEAHQSLSLLDNRFHQIHQVSYFLLYSQLHQSLHYKFPCISEQRLSKNCVESVWFHLLSLFLYHFQLFFKIILKMTKLTPSPHFLVPSVWPAFLADALQQNIPQCAVSFWLGLSRSI